MKIDSLQQTEEAWLQSQSLLGVASHNLKYTYRLQFDI